MKKFGDLKLKCPLCHKNNIMVSMHPKTISVTDVQLECCEDDCGCVFVIRFDEFENDVE